MQIGVVFPQTEIGNDPAAIRDYAQAAEGLGFTHILAYDHVLGANPDRPGGWQGRPYTFRTPFHEVFVLLSYFAAITRRIGLVTGVVILPQRQAALVAKQAASLDVLSGGRLRLGVGLGWNEVEYAALNENFRNRGKRIEEQIEVMKRLWADELVDFKGKYHTIPDAGINPLPPRRAIPVWFGGHHEAVLARVARQGNGWMPNYAEPADARPSLELLQKLFAEAGRPRQDLGIEARISYARGNVQAWRTLLEGWQAQGATHITFNTMGSGLAAAREHIGAIEQIAKEVL
ncbi:MAG: LLM class F420-dependent oxidoreductase [Chloroflexota bacterium]